MMKRHAALFWEGDPNMRKLLTITCDSIVQDADVGVSWTSRHFGLDATRSFVKRNAFEERAMARLRNGSNGQREVWSEDHRQYILAVVAKSDNCAKCHEGTNLAGLAKGAVLGFTSLEFSKDFWQ
jgi:hypothetical protein